MRTTLTLDDDVELALREAMYRSDKSLKHVVDEAVRAGLGSGAAARAGIMVRPLPLESALAVVDTWLSQPAARVLNPTERHAGILGRLLLGTGVGGNLTTDAPWPRWRSNTTPYSPVSIATFRASPGCASGCCRDARAVRPRLSFIPHRS